MYFYSRQILYDRNSMSIYHLVLGRTSLGRAFSLQVPPCVYTRKLCIFIYDFLLETQQ